MVMARRPSPYFYTALPLAAEAASLIQKETVTVHGIFEIPNSKHQIPNKSQIRNTNDLK
jgi:hypothetical protein